MPDVLFVHGIGVRGEAWNRLFELVSRKAERYLPGFTVHACAWGDAFGAPLNRGGATIPDYTRTGDAFSGQDQASRARWFLLSDDPLLELRVLPEEALARFPGIRIFGLIPPLATNPQITGLLREWSAGDL